MQLTVDVRSSAQMTEFTCRGRVTQGGESDYLFDLVTRPDRRDVFLDLEAIREFDYTGLVTIVVCQEYFASQGRRLFLRLPSPGSFEGKAHDGAPGISRTSLLPAGAERPPEGEGFLKHRAHKDSRTIASDFQERCIYHQETVQLKVGSPAFRSRMPFSRLRVESIGWDWLPPRDSNLDMPIQRLMFSSGSEVKFPA